MIQTFIRAGSRQFTVLTCAVVALAAVRIASATTPVMDARGSAIAAGLDPDATPITPPMSTRRGDAKRSGPKIYDNGIENGVNGWSCELNTWVTDSRIADDFTLTPALTTVNHATMRNYHRYNPGNRTRLEIYRNNTSGGACTPARPFSGNPPMFTYTSTDLINVGYGFGLPIMETEFQTVGLVLAANTYWFCPPGDGVGTGQYFWATSNGNAATCRGAVRSTYWGYPEWTQPAFGSPNEFNFILWGPPGAPPPGPGSCDLTPIETKLDDETRFTDDAELADLQIIIESRASQASVDALEAKADSMMLSLDQLQNTLCDIVRLLHTPNGLRQATCNGVDYEWNGLQGGGGD